MERTLFSQHIPKMNTDHRVICEDIRLWNDIKHWAFTRIRKDENILKTSAETGKPDMRRKENRHLRENQEDSLHVQLKKKYGINDYFANSIVNASKGAYRSVKELRKDNITETRAKLSAVKDRLRKKKGFLTELERLKKGCRDLSLWRKNGSSGRKPRLRLPKGGTVSLDREKGIFGIWRKPSFKKRILLREYDNLYDFELGYLDPKIRQIKHEIHLLEGKEKRLNARITRLKEEKPSVCFGTKAFFRKQDTVYEGTHGTWKHVFRKRRNKGMTISGRTDSREGNYVFSYDPDSHILTYKSTSGITVKIPGVVFPYGQELLDDYVRQQHKSRTAPIAWRIEDHGGSFLVKCIIRLPADHHKNYYYGDGCIGMDTNVDCLACSETDRKGNLIDHMVVPFNTEGLSSGNTEHVLSRALDKVFRWCLEKKKPLVMEDLNDVAATDHYGDKALNRKLSGFAHRKITELAESKSFKYATDLKRVNPAFTSQMGKVKYMGRYGLSVHESAALVIARRGMGFKERLPKRYRLSIPTEKINMHHWSHWRHLHKNFKETKPEMFYYRPGRLRVSGVFR